MTRSQHTTYFLTESPAAHRPAYQSALGRSLDRLDSLIGIAGLRNPKIGQIGNRWAYCDGPDWVMGFLSGQLWLAYQLTGNPALAAAARARRPQFRAVLENRKARDHDLGFMFSLSSVAEFLSTGDEVARAMALDAARCLLGRFREDGQYLQAWNPVGPQNRSQAKFANGRMIADTIQNLALLHWAHRETGVTDFREVADLHEDSSLRHLVRADDTSYHTFLFDPATGEPLRGETHQGYADESSWARGQAWLIHGFANCHRLTGRKASLDAACRLAAKAELLMGDSAVPVWDYALPADGTHPIDSSAAAIMAAGVLMLADLVPKAEAARWRAFGHRLLDGLLDHCDLTQTPGAEGLLAHGAGHVPAGRGDAMLPYGDYYFIEALMRAQGHQTFFW
ncbi:glycoside hydrolase family 88 protein [Pseudorhodobacter sp. MZDSW-24AT]|uniref:glycoside hydrolase family 88 protein n=1 Tax=Pseudorhodobacter sp. MZDSW-24AT TaxID=2052957 RepID=UPI000C1EBB56|nr:glycoside hydrolase family 88 protein [Pseudorhodobacter sp. MZDSW-24AT]PJF09359.1 glycosyl hydrolase [Pseudorhodobacter sp. MZDSW-24AT]